MLKHKNFQVLLYKKEGLVLKHISSKTHDLISAKRLLVMRIRLNILLSCLDCGPSPLLLMRVNVIKVYERNNTLWTSGL